MKSNRMTAAWRLVFRPAGWLAVAGGLLMAACGGGGGGGSAADVPVNSVCAAGITSGFSGDLNATYADGGGGGGGGGASGAGSGAGAGGGEGKVLGGTMTITRLSDGVVLGSATTDATSGLVSIKPCAADGPLLLTLAGTATARYYDEGTNTLIPFGPTQVLHALVDKFDENIGVSPLTEAAYRYALNNFVGNPTLIAAGTAQILTTGSVAGLTLAQVQTANQQVLTAMNAVVPASTQLATIKSLPTPIDAASSSNVLPANRYGIIGTVIGGFVKQGARNLPSASAPALAAGEQLARDLTDGLLDGAALDRTAAAPAGSSLYNVGTLQTDMIVGMKQMATQFGSGTTSTLLPALPTFTVGGTVAGLATGQSVTLNVNGGSAVVVSSNTAFTFNFAFPADSSYNVTVATQPTGQSCTVANSTGLHINANVSNAAVTCTTVVTGFRMAGVIRATATLTRDASNSINFQSGYVPPSSISATITANIDTFGQVRLGSIQIGGYTRFSPFLTQSVSGFAYCPYEILLANNCDTTATNYSALTQSSGFVFFSDNSTSTNFAYCMANFDLQFLAANSASVSSHAGAAVSSILTPAPVALSCYFSSILSTAVSYDLYTVGSYVATWGVQ
jgi:hypothetical protein